MKAIWKGSISFGLINIPVKLYSATRDQRIKFKELCPDCHSPLKHKRWCENCGKEIKYPVYGFEIEKDKFVIFTKEELSNLKVKGEKYIELIMFTDLKIDPIFYVKHYYLIPEGQNKAYFLFKEILEITGKTAIGKLIMRNKEYIVAIRPYKKGLLLSTLRYPYEINDLNVFSELDQIPLISEEEKKLGIELINSLSSDLDLTKFKDTYLERFKEAIQKKVGIEKEEKERKAIELMEALKESIEKIKKQKKENV